MLLPQPRREFLAPICRVLIDTLEHIDWIDIAVHTLRPARVGDASRCAYCLAHCARSPADATAIAVGAGSVRVSAPLDEVHVEVLSRTGRHWYLSLPVGRDITRRRVAEIIEGAREVYLTGSYGSIDGRTWLFSGPMLARSLADCAPRVPVNRAPISS